MSILDNEIDLVNNNDVIIRSFIETNYLIGSYTIQDNIVDVKGKVRVKNHKIKSLTNGLFSFGVVDGSFYCSNCNSLKTLEGAPEKVDRSFSCSNNNLLKTLKGAPKKVGGYFYCGYCNALTSLEGSPREVGENFYCDYCNSLTTLKGAPAKIGGDFYCSQCPSLTTLEGAPKNVKIIK